MIEVTQITTRLLALVASVAIFAGLWANDHPDSAAVAQAAMPTLSPLARSVEEPPAGGETEEKNEWRAIALTQIEQEAAYSPPPVPEVRERSIPVKQVAHVSKTFEIETDDLLISTETLQMHLDQLPMGLAAGDYRIVDPLGGIGWLHVRTTGLTINKSKAGQLISTSVDDDQVRFIRVNPTVIGSAATDVAN